MDYLEGILKLTENELESVAKNGKYRSREEIDSVYKLIDIAKDIHCIWKYEDEEDGISYEGSYDNDRSYRGSYDSSYDGSSYARGRGRNAKRDSMGRYSRESNRSYGRYSRDSKQEYIEHLREMMEDAPDDQTRQSIQRMIEQMG